MDIKEYRGIRGLVYAEVLVDNTDTYQCGPVKELVPVAELSRTTETTSETHYYDNVPAIVIESTGKDEVTITGSAIEDTVLADITGQIFDESKGMFVEGERGSKYFAIGYITKKTDGTEIFVWRLKGKFDIPDSQHKTEDDGTEANGQEIVFTGINTAHKFALNDNGTTRYKTVKAVNVDQSINPQVEASFFGSVQTPETVSTSSEIGTLTLVLSAGSTTGKTQVDLVSPVSVAGRKLVYKVAASAQSVTYDQVINDWTALQLDTDIAATAGQVITVAELTKADNKAKKAGSATVIVAV